MFKSTSTITAWVKRLLQVHACIALVEGWLFAGLFPLNAQCVVPSNVKKQIAPYRIQPELQVALAALGDRLKKPQNERLTTIGTIAVGGQSPAPYRLIKELPNLVRLEIGPNGSIASLGFDGKDKWKGGGSLARAESDLLESLVFDTPEQFFYGQVDRHPTRKLGSGFRTDGEIKGRYTGPVYDLYQVAEAQPSGGSPVLPRQVRTFFVNSRTGLVERVQYRSDLDPTVYVKVFIDGWLTVQNSKIPAVFRRVENGSEVFRFTTTAGAITPSVLDAAFCSH